MLKTLESQGLAAETIIWIRVYTSVYIQFGLSLILNKSQGRGSQLLCPSLKYEPWWQKFPPQRLRHWSLGVLGLAKQCHVHDWLHYLWTWGMQERENNSISPHFYRDDASKLLATSNVKTGQFWKVDCVTNGMWPKSPIRMFSGKPPDIISALQLTGQFFQVFIVT